MDRPMRHLIHILVALMLCSGQIVVASPREDAESILETIESGFTSTERLQRFTSKYAEFLADKLAEQAVRVVDPDRLAAMLPTSVVEPWLQRWRENYVAALVERYTPDQLSQFARFLREGKENSVFSDIEAETDILSSIELASSEEFREGAISVLSVVVPMIWSEGEIMKEMKQALPPLNESPYLADILETDGVFSFPNRIWRRDLIASIRNGP